MVTTTETTTLTIRLPVSLNDKLVTLAERTRRSRSFLAGEALSAYAKREFAIIEATERGIADGEAGRVTPHDEAMAQIFQTIEEVAGKQDVKA